jgi:asparagine synthase (glutamine-hydrolysing)
MCGIAGIFAYHDAAAPPNRAELVRIRDHMAARGPDGSGEWYSTDQRVALGHRRLAIIDLSDKGAQPMRSSDGRLVITFNGEIYNYRALRRQLELKGRAFVSDSDTEVLLQLYAEKGEAMVQDLRGMFAFALWDEQRSVLLLARDHFGIKPLYYADDGWTLRFASQVKALRAGGGVSSAPEPAGTVGFHLFGSVPEPFTLYQEIRSVPAGTVMRIDSMGPSRPLPYFSIAATWATGENHSPISTEDARVVAREALRDSVEHHLVADVPVGAFLSAGIDSGAVVGLMAEHQGASALKTMTLSFGEYRGSERDEAPLAAETASSYGTSHTNRVVSEREFLDDLPKILHAMDQPSIDGINTWYISKAASEAGLKVAVSGLGGDELFGGYPSFSEIPRWVRSLWLPGKLPGLASAIEQLQAIFSPLFPSMSPKAAGLVRYGGSYAGAYLLRRGLFLPRELPALMDPEVAREGLRRLDPLGRIGATLRDVTRGGSRARGSWPKRPFGRIATLESSWYMRNQLLRDTDWASMAHSLEVRLPLVDPRLLERLAGPLSAVEMTDRKQLLASAPARPLPRAVALRRKSGFTTPVNEWQQHINGGPSWRNHPLLAAAACPWARRWGWSVLRMSGA